MNWGIKVLQTSALPLGYGAGYKNRRQQQTDDVFCNGAAYEARARDLHLGKVALYQLSYIPQEWCLRAESNHRHGDFQSPALPTELQRQHNGDPDGARTHRPLA